MKHVDELVIIGVFLKAVKTSGVRTTQGRTYLRKRRLSSLAFVAHILQNSWGGKITAEHRVVKAKGSWVTQDTPPKKINRILAPAPRPPQHTHTQILMLMFVCLLGKFACIQVVKAYRPFSLHFTQGYR